MSRSGSRLSRISRLKLAAGALAVFVGLLAAKPASTTTTAPAAISVNEIAHLIDTPRGVVEVIESGPAAGTPVVLLPSLGRGARDFDDLARRLADVGYRVLRPEPRGIGRSVFRPGADTLAELALDASAAISVVEGQQVVIVGHAFGNRVARMIATRTPTKVRGLVLLAAGGKVRMEPDIEEALVKSFDLSLPEQKRLDYVARAFFAPGNDPAVWRDGWYAKVAEAQIEATERTPVDEWWKASDVPVLVVQPQQDVLAPPENAERLKKDGGDRVTVVYVDQAGHALLPEQPELVAKHIISYLRRLDR